MSCTKPFSSSSTTQISGWLRSLPTSAIIDFPSPNASLNSWVKVLEMTINNYSIPSMINVLVEDFGCAGINYKTVWLWIMKLIHALASIQQPVLTGIVQVDETFIREAQKGSRELVSYLSKDERYGRKPSKYGIMGPEFATLVTAVDDRGYCVCKASSLGKLTKEIFVDLFEKNLSNPAYICSDTNDVYDNYCTWSLISEIIKQAIIFKIQIKYLYSKVFDNIIFPKLCMTITFIANTTKPSIFYSIQECEFQSFVD